MKHVPEMTQKIVIFVLVHEEWRKGNLFNRISDKLLQRLCWQIRNLVLIFSITDLYKND